MTDSIPRHIRPLPRGIFGFELQPDLPTRGELADILNEGLSKRFGSTQVRYPLIQWLYRVSTLILHVDHSEVLVSLLRDGSRHELPKYQREWMVLIDPFSGPVWRLLRSGTEKDHQTALLAVSNEIHALLSNIPRIVALRWYFKGWDPKQPAVPTPADLPWFPETPEALDRS